MDTWKQISRKLISIAPLVQITYAQIILVQLRAPIDSIEFQRAITNRLELADEMKHIWRP